jgi:hypothetical protein
VTDIAGELHTMAWIAGTLSVMFMLAIGWLVFSMVEQNTVNRVWSDDNDYTQYSDVSRRERD